MTDLPVVVVWGLKATPLLLGAWLVTAVLRRGSAATRHFVWVLATAAVLALPVATVVAPRVELTFPEITTPPPTTAQPAMDAPTAAVVWTAEPAETAWSVSSAASPGPTQAVEPAALLAGIWGVGAALIGALIGLSLWSTARLARRARPLEDPGMVREVRELAARIGVRRPVRLLQARDAAMPMTWGSLHPTVLVPAGFTDWPAARRRAVLVHELAHVRRWDWATQLGARLACALYWWNPLSWVAARRLREERELACDDLVLTQGTQPSAYADDLVEIARAFRARPTTALAAVAMAHRSELAGRLLAVLDAARSRRSLARGHAWTAMGAAAIALLPVAGLAAGTADSADIAVATTPAAAAAAIVAEGGTVEWSTPARPTPPQARLATLCDWAARGGSSSSSTSINDERMMVQIGRDDCTITARAEGELTFTDDERDLRRLARGGHFEIEERSGRARRRVEITDADGALERRWFVDGHEQPYGAEARAWLGDVLLVLVRRAGVNAEARATRILSTQGEEALISEIAQLQSDYVAGRYYRVLFARGTLSSAQTARALADAAERIESDHELGRVLAIVADRGSLDATVLAAYVRATDGLDSDHEHSAALLALLAATTPDVASLDAMLASTRRIESDYARARVLAAVGLRYPPDRALPASYLDAVATMESYHERGRILGQLLERDRLSAGDRARVLAVTTRMGSDHTRSQLLRAVAAQGPLDDATRAAFFTSLRDVESDHSRQQVLVAVVAGSADEATTLAVLDAARAIGSDHSKTQVLTAIAARGPMSERVRAAYAAVAETIGSRANRDRALRAAGLERI